MSFQELQQVAQKLPPQELHQFAQWVSWLDHQNARKAFFALPRAEQLKRREEATQEAAREGLYAPNSPLRAWLDHD
jgi:hypothetical protein